MSEMETNTNSGHDEIASGNTVQRPYHAPRLTSLGPIEFVLQASNLCGRDHGCTNDCSAS
jgi:hypothetical protein